MLMKNSFENISVTRFVVGCAMFTILLNIMSCSVFRLATYQTQKKSASHFFGKIINDFIGIFAKDAFADEENGEETIYAVTDMVPSGRYATGNNSGSFSYSYPIKIPSGRNGLTPKLNINYSSSGLNSLMGIGWNMTMNYIERLTKYGRPAYTDNDTFQLTFNSSNSELIKNDSGEYRLKRDGAFLRIVKSGNTWTVTDKTGTKYTFGETTDAQLIPYSGYTFRWYLKHITDLDGNTITYNYYKDTSNNQVYPWYIEYEADYHIRFVYDPTYRTDTEQTYRLFFSQKTIHRLKEIQIYKGSMSYDDNLVRAYKLNYNYTESGRSKITSIKAYGRNSTLDSNGLVETSSPSLPATTFTYDGGNYSLGNQSTWHNPLVMDEEYYLSYQVQSGDFNGDGKNDIFYMDGSHWHVILSNGMNGFSNSDPYWYEYSSIRVEEHPKLGDFNGDGMTDLLCQDGSGTYVLFSRGDHFEPDEDVLDFEVQANRVGDFNGDGKSDVLFVKKAEDSYQYSLFIYNGASFVGPYQWTGNYRYGGIGDINGDGKNDLICFNLVDPDADPLYGNPLYKDMCIRYSTGTGFSNPVAQTISDIRAYNHWFGDLNGDGKIDLLYLKYDDGLYAMINNGSTFNPAVKWCDFDYGSRCAYQLVDMNGDGKSDLFFREWISQTSTDFKVMLSNGTGFSAPKTWKNTTSGLYRSFAISDFNADGFLDIFFIDQSAYDEAYVYVLINNSKYENITSIKDGLGATTTVEYAPSSEWENAYLPFKIQTAKKMTTTDNVSHTAIKTYTYEGGFYDAGEREYRGFEKSVVKDFETGFTTESHYFQDSLFKGRLSYSATTDTNSNMVQRTSNKWCAVRLLNDSPYGSVLNPNFTDILAAKNYRAFVYLYRKTVYNYDKNNELFSSTSIYNKEFDDYGNILLKEVRNGDEILNYSIYQYTRTVFDNDTSKWFLGKPTKIRIDTSDPGTSSDTPALRETQYSYYSDRPWLIENEDRIHWTDDTNYDTYTTTYGYDQYGNLTSEIDPRGMTNAETGVTTKINYDSNGMFPIETINALGQTTTRTFDADFGKVYTETGPNFLTTTTNYDDFGRVDDVTYPDYSYKDYSYHVAANNHYVSISASEQPTVTTYYDNFGRKTKEKKLASDGATIWTETQYDDAGRVTWESLPSFYESCPEGTAFHYDSVRGYLDIKTNPDSTFKTFSKNGFIETITDENGHTKTITKDPLDRIIKVEEAIGSTAEYEYDIFDNLLNVLDPLDNETSIEYDDLGRKVAMVDPYMGTWEYEYDENGNLVLQVDGNGDQTVMEYDELNRLEEKYYITDGTQASYIYDEERPDYYNIGSLTTVEFGDMVTEYNYDKMGRTVNETKTISGTTYPIDRQFNLAGRLEYIQYPDSSRTQYDYFYNPIGTLSSVETDGTPLAEFFEYNALGQVGSVINKNLSGTYYVYKDDGSYRLDALTTVDGDNVDIQDFEYDFDDVGNITSIKDNVSSTTQSFTYDNIDRLLSAVATSSDAAREYDQSYTYDLSGNMIERTGIGPFKVLEWEDSTKHIRPALINYTTEITGLADRTVDYYQNDKPSQISYDGTTTTDLYYDGEGNRVRKVQGGQEVVYVGNIYEERDGDSLSYIYANGKKFVTITDSHEYYTHTDHLGSTTLTTDETGQVIEEIGYLPFGAELFRATYNSGTWESSYKFTGQEFDKEYQFYNYNARLYDPVMGRFITPDNIVQDLYDPQSLNRYAYCRNNPLIYTDPTGNSWWGWWNDFWNWFSPETLGDSTVQPPPSQEEETVEEDGLGGKAFDKFEEIFNPQFPSEFGNMTAEEQDDYIRDVHSKKMKAPFTTTIEIGLLTSASKEGTKSLWSRFKSIFAPKNATTIDPNKLNHIFGQAGHNLDNLVKQFGSQEGAFNALRAAAERTVSSQGISGVFETSVTVGTETITVRGNVVEGVVKIGTAFKP